MNYLHLLLSFVEFFIYYLCHFSNYDVRFLTRPFEIMDIPFNLESNPILTPTIKPIHVTHGPWSNWSNSSFATMLIS